MRRGCVYARRSCVYTSGRRLMAQRLGHCSAGRKTERPACRSGKGEMTSPTSWKTQTALWTPVDLCTLMKPVLHRYLFKCITKRITCNHFHDVRAARQPGRRLFSASVGCSLSVNHTCVCARLCVCRSVSHPPSFWPFSLPSLSSQGCSSCGR